MRRCAHAADFCKRFRGGASRFRPSSRSGLSTHSSASSNSTSAFPSWFADFVASFGGVPRRCCRAEHTACFSHAEERFHMKLSTRASPFTPKALFTIVGGMVLINPAFSQEQAAAGEELQEVVVTGLRGSLKASMDTKRDAIGVVDAINAEDIGKFPDTNLSEALQRITGVSIDRRNGEGAVVTARGFGPQFNMVTLNGRQMPAADAFANGTPTGGGVAGNSRSFNFANLSAEAISAVEVYKTGRADIATGGIGASINIRTARPLDNDGLVLNLGAKALDDTTNRVGQDITPELSGIFSF